jgi:hypothetical protein
VNKNLYEQFTLKYSTTTSSAICCFGMNTVVSIGEYFEVYRTNHRLAVKFNNINKKSILKSYK